MGSVSPSKPITSSSTTKEKFDRTVSPSFLNEEPPSHYSSSSSKLPGLASSITRRRSSVSSNAYHSKDSRPRGSSVSTNQSSNGGSIASRIASENKEKVTGSNDLKDGPPSSWRVGSSTTTRVRTGSSNPSN